MCERGAEALTYTTSPGGSLQALPPDQEQASQVEHAGLLRIALKNETKENKYPHWCCFLIGFA